MKKAQIGIISIILIILIAIIALILAFNIIFPLIKEKSSSIGMEKFAVNLEIKQAVILPSGILKIDVSRTGGGNISELQFIFYDENGKSASENKEGLNELETKIYSFSHPAGFGKIKKVAVVPILGTGIGIENDAETREVLEIPSGVAKWIKFDEDGNQVNYYSENLVFENQMAVSFWINGGGQIENSFFSIQIKNNKANFSCPGVSFESANELYEGWNHVVVSIDAGGVSKIYVNNNVEVFPISSLNLENAELTVSGNVDNIMLFNRALFETDVAGLYIYQKK